MSEIQQKIDAILATNKNNLPVLPSDLPPTLTQVSSASLREFMEKDGLKDSAQFVSILLELDSEITRIDDSASKLLDAANTLTTNAFNATSTSGSQEIIDAIKQRDDAKTKLDAMESFLGKFKIGETQQQALVGPPTPAFLEVLKEIGDVHENLTNAFSSDSSSTTSTTTSGLDMLETLTEKQENAYEKLYNYITTTLSLDNLDPGDPETIEDAYSEPFTRAALSALSNRPAFASHTQELIVSFRRNAVTKRFLLALTGTGNGTITITPHDPVSYVGDVLAWVHRAVSEENEVYAHIYPAEEESSASSDLLAKTVSGLSRPLRTRIETTFPPLVLTHSAIDDGSVECKTKVILLFSLAGVIKFYKSKIEQASSRHSSLPPVDLCDALDELHKAVCSVYEESLQVYGESLRVFSSSSNSFQLSKQTVGSLAQQIIADMRKANELNPESDSNVMNFVLKTILAPALALSETLDDVMKLKESVTIDPQNNSSDWVQRIDEKIEIKLGSTIIAVSENVLEQVGLMEIISLINSENPSPTNPMSSIIGLEQAFVSRSIAQFYSSLHSPPIPSFEEIDSAEIRARLTTGIKEKIISSYSDLYFQIKDPQARYTDTDSWLNMNPNQIQGLL
ncbi:hypothetical protein TrLO_g15939 [Triparma laevis f. longispina]|uniref:Conserved Oligomeric Golgi complex subunit 6 C-terminal domain-containing protein n=1 Tax=Triparma laevis f. longispina TaxID=1714387 RepID=A0A9W7DXV2_9STRA|nr:hypothetical protein TrLO_g15939 [Triparma laevis f. longispina]